MEIISMKQVVTEEKVITKYKAVDGVVFDTYTECMDHE